MIKLRDLTWRDYPGFLVRLSVITSVLISERERLQLELRKEMKGGTEAVVRIM